MPKFDEITSCHFFPEQECWFPLTEDELKYALENWEEEVDGDILSQVPSEDSSICTNCLLSQVLHSLNRKMIKLN